MKTIFFAISLLIGFFAYSQDLPSNKRVEKKGIKHFRIVKSEYETGTEEKQIEVEAFYDKNGEIIELKEWDGDGKLKKHEKYEYDDSGNKVKETEFDSKGKVDKITEYKYKGKLRTEKTILYPNGKIKSKRVYSYEFYDE